MVTNEINLVELIAGKNNYLTDTDDSATYKKVICKQSEISRFREISELEALAIEIKNKKKYENEEDEGTVTDEVGTDSLDSGVE